MSVVSSSGRGSASRHRDIRGYPPDRHRAAEKMGLWQPAGDAFRTVKKQSSRKGPLLPLPVLLLTDGHEKLSASVMIE